MQQTETYKLNLIDKNDTFSPDPLNENTQKLEEALTGKFAALDGADADLDRRVTALEVHKIAVGSYAGNATARTFQLGFTPVAVIVEQVNSGTIFMATTIQAAPSSFAIIQGGFSLKADGYMNHSNHSYYYLAIC